MKNSFVVVIVNFQILKTLAKLRVLSRNHFQWACPCRIKLLLLAISRAYRGIIYLLSGEMEKLLFEQRELGWMKRKNQERAWFKGKKLCFFFIDWTGAEFVFLLYELENQWWWWTFLVIMNPLTKISRPEKLKATLRMAHDLKTFDKESWNDRKEGKYLGPNH